MVIFTFIICFVLDLIHVLVPDDHVHVHYYVYHDACVYYLVGLVWS